MDKSWINKPRLSNEYITGVKGFIQHAFGRTTAEMVKCPCCRCCLRKWKNKEDLEGDLMYYGFLPSYTCWFFHGEDLNTTRERERENQLKEGANISSGGVIELVNDIFPNFGDNINNESGPSDQGNNMRRGFEVNDTDEQRRTFDELVEDANQELYEGCRSFTKLTFMLKLYHIKCLCGISDKGMSMIVSLLKEAFEHAKLPDSFNDLKKIIRKLGMTYESIHACPNDCMLYWNDDADKDCCKVCQTSRWKTKDVGNSGEGVLSQGKKKKKKQAAKILRYFPLKPRLQRLFMSSRIAKEMRWHMVEENVDGKLRHPRDGAAWKSFNLRYPEFASDPRNIRLGLASDGFNPFGTMSTNYSIWPVLLFPYNLPPWMCMKQTSLILSMIIPGKNMPGNDIDVYLQPLIKELKELWYDGVTTFDAYAKETFRMHATLLWTVSDFPGLGNLSGWNTHTGLACPSCNFDANNCYLRHGKKHCFLGHRRFLPQNHKFRFDEQRFDGSKDTRRPARTPSGSEILSQLQSVEVIFGKKYDVRGRKRIRNDTDSGQWKKKSIFFDLPYWEHVLLRHNLDVMHIEKNVFDNLVYTLLDEKGRSKDNLSARKDLREWGLRSELWPDDYDKYRPACFTMNNTEKDIFLAALKNLKLPDGYSSNISRCVDTSQRKLIGLKSHDCHVLMGHLLPIALRNVLPQHVTNVLVEFCRFFKDICSTVLDVRDLDQLQQNLVVCLCHMEMIFPPSFFTVMVHLTAHLTEEAKLGGPVQFRWMYPIERVLGRFKSYVRNRARPEGSICEQYLADECLTFCSMYLDDIETRFSRTRRVDDEPSVPAQRVESLQIRRIFPLIGRPVGAIQLFTLRPTERIQAHRYVLVNCPLLDGFRE